MEYRKITNLDRTFDHAPRKWIEAHDQWGSVEDRHKPSKQIRFETSMFRSNFCDYSDAYIVVKETITVRNPSNNAMIKLAFKSNAPFTTCILKINNTLTDNADYLNIVMPMYKLIDYIKNYSKTIESSWNYYRDQPKSGAEGNTNYSIKDSKSFDYKTRITGRLGVNDTEKEVGIIVPLKHLRNFWITL